MLILDRMRVREAAEIIARMPTPPDSRRTNLIHDTVRALKRAHIWPQLDVLYVGAAHDLGASLVNWGRVGSRTFGVVGSPTFAADKGGKSTGSTTTDYLDTGWNVASLDGLYNRNWAHIAGVFLKEGTEQGTIGGWTNTRLGLANTGVVSLRVNSSGTLNLAGSYVTTRYVASRVDSTQVLHFRNGTPGSSANASAALAGSTPRILASSGLGATWRVPWWSMGGGLSILDAQKYDWIIRDYCQAVGAL